jgi:hypothetical protein
LNGKCADYIINSANYAFGFTILWGSVWTREAQKNPMCGGEVLEGAVVEFTSIIALDGLKGERELCSDISAKVR